MTFVSGQRVTAAQLNSAAPIGAVQSVVNTTSGTTSSGTYTDTLSGTSTVSLNFVVPPSGAIWVTTNVGMFSGANTVYAVTSYRISGSAGTVAASDNWQIYTKQVSTMESLFTRRTMQTGLTPGATGTVTMQHRNSNGSTTCTFNHRQLLIEPVPA